MKKTIEHLIDDGTVEFVLANLNRYDRLHTLFAVTNTERKIARHSYGDETYDKKTFQKIIKKENGFLILDPTCYSTTKRGYVFGQDHMYPNFKTGFKNFEDFELHSKVQKEAEEKHQAEKEFERQESIRVSNEYHLEKWNKICEEGWQKRTVSKETISNRSFTKYTFEAVQTGRKTFNYLVAVLVSDEPINFGYSFGNEECKEYGYFITYAGFSTYTDGDLCQDIQSYKDKETGNSEEAVKKHLIQNLVSYFH